MNKRERTLQALRQIDPIVPYLEQANVIHIKTTRPTTISLRAFVAGLMSYQPSWVTFLYRLRWGFVRLLGMKQEGVPKPKHMDPAEVPFEPGQLAYFFTVEVAEEGHYWMAGATDKHLSAYLLVTHAEGDRFHFVTLVDYHHWTGPVYYNVIRPFHHLIAARMTHHALRPDPSAQPAA